LRCENEEHKYNEYSCISDHFVAVEEFEITEFFFELKHLLETCFANKVFNVKYFKLLATLTP